MTQTKVEAPFVQSNANFRNLFINGDMDIAQRATSTSSVNATGYYACDRWSYKTNGSGLVVTMSQDTDVPTGEGFTTSLKFDVTTADTSTASAERVHFGQTIEAQNLQHLASATSSAKKVTLSFWVKSTITGTYAVAIYKSDQTGRLVNATYTVSSADTWEHKTITFPGDTGGGGIDNDNGSGFQFDWFLIAGTGSTSGGAQTTWANFASASWAGGHNVNFGSSTDNNYYITGVQLEVGDQATDFEHLPTDVQLARCQRYCRLLKMQGIHYTYQFSTNWSRANPTYGSVANEMRDLPSASWLSATPTYDDASQTVAADENKFRWGYNGATNDTSPSSTLGIDNIGFYSLSVYNNAINHSTDGSSGFVIWAKQSAIVLDAEL